MFFPSTWLVISHVKCAFTLLLFGIPCDLLVFTGNLTEIVLLFAVFKLGFILFVLVGVQAFTRIMLVFILLFRLYLLFMWFRKMFSGVYWVVLREILIFICFFHTKIGISI